VCHPRRSRTRGEQGPSGLLLPGRTMRGTEPDSMGGIGDERITRGADAGSDVDGSVWSPAVRASVSDEVSRRGAGAGTGSGPGFCDAVAGSASPDVVVPASLVAVAVAAIRDLVRGRLLDERHLLADGSAAFNAGPYLAVAHELDECRPDRVSDGAHESSTDSLVPLNDWCRRVRVAPSSARRWCGLGRLPGARRTRRGDWLVPRDAVPPTRRGDGS
jgi:hypothetical protein